MLQLEEAVQVREAQDVKDEILLEAVEAEEAGVDVLEKMLECYERRVHQLDLGLGALPHPSIEEGSEVF